MANLIAPYLGKRARRPKKRLWVERRRPAPLYRRQYMFTEEGARKARAMLPELARSRDPGSRVAAYVLLSKMIEAEIANLPATIEVSIARTEEAVSRALR